MSVLGNSFVNDHSQVGNLVHTQQSLNYSQPI